MGKHLTENIYSVKGYLNRKRQGIQSTKHVPNKLFEDEIANIQLKVEKLQKQYPSFNLSRTLSKVSMKEIEQGHRFLSTSQTRLVI